ncbi:MAG TPA: NUDIX hydrolase [Nocardioidaceae bacterium]
MKAEGRPADTPESWPVLSTTTESEGAIVSVFSEEIEAPDGGRFVRQVVRHPGAVAVVAVDSEDRVLVLSQYRHPVRQRLVELPAGLLDVDGEDPESAAVRELAEEAQLSARHWSVLVDVLTSPGIHDEAVRIFLAEELSEIDLPAGFEAEHEEADMSRHWVRLDELVTAILDGEVKDSLTVSGSLALWARRHGYGSGKQL